jgi:hypothetical protein
MYHNLINILLGKKISILEIILQNLYSFKTDIFIFIIL